MALPLFPFRIDQKYEALELLGKGGAGYAVLAKHKDQPVAIKLLNLTLAKDPQKVIQKFKKEFLTLKKLNHPHIGKIYDFGFDSGLNFYYFVGEYIRGQDIRKATLNLSPEKSEALFVQTLQALHYLHTFGRAGLRHNDIKTANILVTQDNTEGPAVKLIDFGLTTFAPLDMRGGTASYMSPEQLLFTFPDLIEGMKMPKPDARADLYALGVVWYYCLTGLNPFWVERDPQATLKRHFEFFPQPPSSLRQAIPSYLDKIILKLLKINPDQRYASAAEVIQDLRYLSGKPYSVIPQAARGYFLPWGEWINQEQTWKPLKAKWPPKGPEHIWIIGETGQGKSKILEHFKNYVQAQEGRVLLLKQPEAVAEWLDDLKRAAQNLSQKTVVAVDDYHEKHPARPHLEELWKELRYAQHWDQQRKIPWLFVFTASAGPMDHPEFFTTTLHLRNFNLGELKEWLRSLSPKKDLPPPEKFLHKLYRHTEGNPLWVTSVLKIMGEKGLLWNDDGAWSPALFQEIGVDFGKLDIPKDLTDILQTEWQARTHEEKGFLKWLACFPGGADLALCQDPECLEKLTRLGLLEVDEKKRIGFKNPFWQKNIYEGLAEREKEAAHRRIARALNQRETPAHRLAYHTARCGSPRQRLRSLEELAGFYGRAGMFEEEIAARQQQLALLLPARWAKQLEVVIHTARLLKNHLRFDRAHCLLDDWLEKLPKTKTYARWRAALLRQKGLVQLRENKPKAARQTLEVALAAVAKLPGQPKDTILIENTIAKSWLDEGKIDRAIAIYRQTREAGKKFQVENNDLGYAYLLAQKREKAMACLTEDSKLLEKAEDKTRWLRSFFLLGSAERKLMRDYPAAIKHYQRCAELARALRDPDWRMRALNGMAATYLDSAHADGHPKKKENAFRQALAFFEESLAICRQLKKDLSNLDFETAAIHLNMATCHQEMGNFVKAADELNTIITVLEAKPKKESREWARLCEAYVALADNCSLQNRHAEMGGPIKKAWTIAKAQENLLEHQLALQILWAEWAQATDHRDQLKKHLGLAEKIRDRHHIQPTPLAKQRLEKLKAL